MRSSHVVQWEARFFRAPANTVRGNRRLWTGALCRIVAGSRYPHSEQLNSGLRGTHTIAMDNSPSVHESGHLPEPPCRPIGPPWSSAFSDLPDPVESRRTLRTAACGARPFATTPARTDTPPQLAPSRSSPPPTGLEKLTLVRFLTRRQRNGSTASGTDLEVATSTKPP